MTTSPAGFLPTLRMAVKSTFIIMGVIMSQIRTAMGALIWLPWPNSRPRRACTTAGTSFPRATPATTEAVVYMANLPLDANVQFMTVMATKMPFIGRG